MNGTVVVLTGGVGGSKLVAGLCAAIDPARVTAIVNTGDDFQHFGLHISPDVDTLTYTLAGLADPDRGWGRRDETWHFMETLALLGGPDWFSLGDRDLALHIERTRRLGAGETLTKVTLDMAVRLGVRARIVPMSDDPCGVIVETDEGRLDFQSYFVARRCAPRLTVISLDRSRVARPSKAALDALAAPSIGAIIVAPSNPWLSIDPLLAVPGLVDAIKRARAPVIAVTPLPGGRAVKGPTAKIMEELGLDLSIGTIVAHYHGLIDGIVADMRDADPDRLPFVRTDTIMISPDDRLRVARAALELAGRLEE